MATQVTNYQCPSCTGPLAFSPETGKLECEFCGSSYTPAQVEEFYAEENRKVQENAEKAAENPAEEGWGEESAHMRAYQCPSCGAELICDETTAATACPYCGNPSVVPGQFSQSRKPDHVIPFKMSKEAAVEALKAHYKGKPLLPGRFATENHLQEIKGVYVPFWLFSGGAQADVTFSASRSRTVTTANEQITTTDHYQVRRAGSLEFCQIPADASTKMPDAHMDAIEPYDYGELQPFSMAYLPGFLADKYDVEPDASEPRIRERCRNSAIAAMEADVTGYDCCSVQNARVDVDLGEAKYALLPVWLLSTKWQDKNYLFAMNGQTGKLVGDLPVSKGKLALWFLGLLALLSGLSSLIVEIEFALLMGAVISLIVCAVMSASMKTARLQTDAHSYIADSGIRITGRSDRFLHRSVSRQRLENNSGRKK